MFPFFYNLNKWHIHLAPMPVFFVVCFILRNHDQDNKKQNKKKLKHINNQKKEQ